MRLFPSAGCDWLVVGLGNPGGEYQNTRHNAGFMAVDRIADALGVRITKIKYKALCATASYRGQKLLLLKPETFMNASGLAVEAAAHFYKIPPERVLVLFDDISLPVGKIRVRKSGSAGGHNGIKSIIGGLNSQSFPRVKIGVGAKPHPDYDLADWVLSNFTGPEDKLITEAAARAADAALEIIARGVPAAANDYNGAGPQ